VRILRVAGSELLSGANYNVTSDEPVVGNIPQLIERAWPAIRPLLTYKTQFGPDARFEQKYIYPELACQEALVNAIAHRDYTTSSGVEVFIFDERLEIRNPGALLSTLSIEDLKSLNGAHESRNSLVAKVLRENFKVMRELGEGMRRIFQVMSDSELDKPLLASGANHFAVTLENKSSFSAQQEQWLLMFQQFNISPLQKRILLVGMGDREISPADIYKAIGKDRDTYDKEVTGLRNAGLLVEIRTSAAAKQYADSRKVLKNTIARFRVQIPGVNVSGVSALAPANRNSSRKGNFVRATRPVFSGFTGGRLSSVTAGKGTAKNNDSRPQSRPSTPTTRKPAIDLRLLTTRKTQPVSVPDKEISPDNEDSE
jgi:ATP-dependent DNA helicase RecG